MMTAEPAKQKKLGKTMRTRMKRLPFFPLAVLLLLLFFLRNSALAKDAVLAGLRRAALGVLPSVFPFLVLSDLLVSVGGLPHKIGACLSPLFRLPPAACAAILLGWICGFPIGAVYAAKEAEAGNLAPEDGERAVAAASVPSPAFLVGVVGGGVFHRGSVGLILWFLCVFSAAVVCAVGGIGRKNAVKNSENSLPSAPEPFFRLFTGAVRRAANVALNLCAFIAFFSVLIAATGAVSARFGVPSGVFAWGAALLELSGGIDAAGAISTPLLLPFCAACCGWSGFSVHFQIFAVCEKMRLRYGKYLFAKALQAILCFGLSWLSELFR